MTDEQQEQQIKVAGEEVRLSLSAFIPDIYIEYILNNPTVGLYQCTNSAGSSTALNTHSPLAEEVLPLHAISGLHVQGRPRHGATGVVLVWTGGQCGAARLIPVPHPEPPGTQVTQTSPHLGRQEHHHHLNTPGETRAPPPLKHTWGDHHNLNTPGETTTT